MGVEASYPGGGWTLARLPLPVPCATGNFLVPPEKSINKIGHGKLAPGEKEMGKLRPEECRGFTQSLKSVAQSVAQTVALPPAVPPLALLFCIL